uniref:DNA helicase Pif1-like 2B domain-containing protein n=1 Tax=Octopus bimaculoides TaxID=37653 RepID=A0A0L8I2M1_OCTBM
MVMMSEGKLSRQENEYRNGMAEHCIRSPHIYKSVDRIPDPEEVVNNPTEFLNSLEQPGLPPHRLELKVGTPVMLLRSLDPPTLCNGTRLVVKKMMPHVIETTILSEYGKREDVFIPRIPLIPLGAEISFSFRRVQFPIHISLAMSINKSQGQTLSMVELHLEEVGSKINLFPFVPQGKTKNIVYQEVL